MFNTCVISLFHQGQCYRHYCVDEVTKGVTCLHAKQLDSNYMGRGITFNNSHQGTLPPQENLWPLKMHVHHPVNSMGIKLAKVELMKVYCAILSLYYCIISLPSHIFFKLLYAWVACSICFCFIPAGQAMCSIEVHCHTMCAFEEKNLVF